MRSGPVAVVWEQCGESGFGRGEPPFLRSTRHFLVTRATWIRLSLGHSAILLNKRKWRRAKTHQKRLFNSTNKKLGHWRTAGWTKKSANGPFMCFFYSLSIITSENPVGTPSEWTTYFPSLSMARNDVIIAQRAGRESWHAKVSLSLRLNLGKKTG